MKPLKGMWLYLLQLTVLILITSVASAQLHADFSATPQTGCPPMVVNFKDSSTGNPTRFKWDLGNGTISYLQNPIATYFNPGTYNVKLVVENDKGIDSIVRNEFIVVNALPVPSFKVSDSAGCFPLKVDFTDNSLAGSGTIDSWQWDFGDGTLSTDKNPTHTYTNGGNFTVILRIINSNGCSAAITKPAFIKVPNGVKADFSYTSIQGCQTPAPVNFSNETVSTGTVKYLWDFGDGKTSTDINPVNNYKSGVYTVKLIATTAFGCSDTIIKTNAINIGSVHANFAKPDSVCVGSSLNLINTSTPTTFRGAFWNFGDETYSNAVSPQKTYTKAGTFQVKLIADFGSCLDSIIKPITVLDKPTAAFTASNVLGCTSPLIATFSNTSTNAVSYLWDFGDGKTSTLKNPEHTYTSSGSFSVKLTVTNANGCSDSQVKTSMVNISPLKINTINNLMIKGCLPVTVTPVATIKNNFPIATYLWDFGDGSTSTDATPSHTYTTAGFYNVKLTVATSSGCIDTLTVYQAVKAGNKPVAQFSADPKDVCAFTPVNFTDLSKGDTIHEWLWSFGDGGSSVLPNPAYSYNDTGYFNVTLISYNYGCSDTLKMPNYIHVRPPLAKFDPSFSCNDRLKRDFINKSVGATNWKWDFGDGSTSTVQNPSHTYAAPGNYPVALTVSNGQCRHEMKKDVVVIKEKGNLEADDYESCLNTRIIFNVKNITTANINTYSWFFNGLNDYAIVTQNNPVAWSFNTPGVRNTAIVLTDILGCKDTLTAPMPVKTYGPKASFGSLNPNTCFGNTVNFTDSTKTDGIHPVTQYLWNYGEGSPLSYTSGPFFHDYSATGFYNVKLLVKDNFGCADSITRLQYVNITKPVAKFTPSDTMLCPSSPITFTNQSTGVNVSYNWNFGDGTSSIDFSPVHTFANPGSYKVKMIMVDKNGCGDSASVTIHAYAARADFALSDSFSTCPPLVVKITNRSSNYTQLNWDFGDGGNSQLEDPSHIYTYPGNYTIKILVKNNGGCIDTLMKKVVIQGPTGVFDYTPKEVCNPGTVNFEITTQNTVKNIWDFNDGTTIFSTDQTTSHTYVTPGIYLPKIILEDEKGCKVAVVGKDTIKIHSIKTDILSNTKMLCDSGYIAFRDTTSSDDQIKEVMWNFGDGTSSNVRNPTHNYADTGFYSVKLVTTTRFGCVDSAFSQNYVKVVSSPSITMSGGTSVCEPAKLKFAADLVRKNDSAVTWNWNFGNGQVSDQQQPDSQAYAHSGSYPVTVKATNNDGCINIVTRTAVIHPKPLVDAGPNAIICRSANYTLKASGATDYTWNASPSLSCTNCISPVANPDSSIIYHVTGKSLFGCTNEDSVTIKVQQRFNMTVDKGDTLCKGETLALKASGADIYSWTPSLWLDNTNVAAPKTKPDTTITYQVVGRDSIGCFKDTSKVSIKVYPVPSIEITTGNNLTVPIGGNIKLTTTNSADVTDWKWFPSQWLSCASCSEPLAAPKENITYSVTATNEGKCTARDQVTINVICNNANVYMPNTFSPNGDGVNDVFYPRGTGLYNILTFKVFNRWGQMVFQKNGISANDPQFGWNGTLNGLPLQSDVYVYMLEVVCSNNIIFPFKGNVSLIR